MQILAGQYKSRRIITSSKLPYRPTQTRIRKSLFDILGNLSGKTVLDLYAGSGILGFEAASRGAAEITFVEKNRKMTKILHRNSSFFTDTIFNVENDSAEAFLDTDELYDIIIADPPYELTEAKNGTTGKSLIDLCFNRLKLHGTFILEMSSKSDIKGDREKYYGDTKLVFWNK